MERVGQYLEDCDLQTPIKQHDWNNLLSENECLRDSALIFPHHKNQSLIQECNSVKKNITELFQRPNNQIGENFQLKSRIICSALSADPVHTAFISNEVTPSDMLVATTSANDLIYIEIISKNELKSSRLNFMKGPFTQPQFKDLSDMVVRDLKFYNESTMSLLLRGLSEGRSVNYFIQFGMPEWQATCSHHHITKELDLRQSAVMTNCFEFVDVGCFSKPIDGNTCVQIAVSGSRKVRYLLVSSLGKLSTNNRRTQKNIKITGVLTPYEYLYLLVM